jgi:hypothetical protein
MKSLFAIVFFTFLGVVQAQTVLPEAKKELPVKPIGTFMRVKSDGEHAYGYDIELWKQGDKICGLISAHQGLIGDPPTGLLENVRFDPKTRRFSFTAKLSLGMLVGNDDKEIPSHDVFEFDGTLTDTRIAGNLQITSQSSVEKKKLNLPRSKDWSKEMSAYKSFAEWKVYADEILDFRGPRW